MDEFLFSLMLWPCLIGWSDHEGIYTYMMNNPIGLSEGIAVPHSPRYCLSQFVGLVVQQRFNPSVRCCIRMPEMKFHWVSRTSNSAN